MKKKPEKEGRPAVALEARAQRHRDVARIAVVVVEVGLCMTETNQTQED